MTISKEVLLNRYADHLSDLFPKRKIRDRAFSGFVFEDNRVGNQFHKTIEVLSMILGKVFPSEIDLRSLKFVGHLIEKICDETDEGLLPKEKVSLSYQQFLQTLGAVQYFSMHFFPPFNVGELKSIASQKAYVKERHLPIGIKVTFSNESVSNEFKFFSWKLNFKRLIDENGVDLQPYLRRQLLNSGYARGVDLESEFSFFCWNLYEKTFDCIKEILTSEKGDFFFLQGVGVDFQSFLKEQILQSDLRKLFDVCFFKKGICSQVLVYRKNLGSKPEDKSVVSFKPFHAYLQVSQMQTELGSCFFLNADVDDVNYEQVAKKTMDLVEQISAILKENKDRSIFFLIAGSIKTAENLEKFLEENLGVQVLRLKTSYFTELQIFRMEKEIKKNFGSFDEFIVLQGMGNLQKPGLFGVDSLDMRKVIGYIQQRNLGF